LIRKINPSFRERVWGVHKLAPWFADQEEKIGEVWFEQTELPLLVKFLFTSDNLSVQVHPDDSTARERHNSLGKTEMWHILAAEPGAKIAAGFRELVSKDRMREAALSGEIVDLLAWHDARPGDTFFIPAGTVHAIGAGLTLCEIQENSDITYRLYDYGRGRELHLDDGISVSSGDRFEARVVPKGDVLVYCKHFRACRVTSPRRLDGEQQIAIVIEGSGMIGNDAAKAGEVWIVDTAVDLTGAMTLLLAN
jgi:mannose-6-phosphate isomerase